MRLIKPNVVTLYHNYFQEREMKTPSRFLGLAGEHYMSVKHEANKVGYFCFFMFLVIY